MSSRWHRCHFLLWTRNQRFDFVYLAGKSGEPEISAVEEEGQVIPRFFCHLYLPVSGAEFDGGVYGLAMERLQHLIDLGRSFTVVIENHVQLAGVKTELGGAVLLRNAGNTRKEYGKHFPSTWISRRHCLDIQRRHPGMTPDRMMFQSTVGAGVWLMVIRWFFIRATVWGMGVPVSGASSTGCSSDISSSGSWVVNGSSTRMQLSSTCVDDKSSSILGWKSADAVPDAGGGEQSGEVSSGSDRLGLTGSFPAMVCGKKTRRNCAVNKRGSVDVIYKIINKKSN
ncbi:uncharacterized protein LOC120352399 [Nilaparvata lugens]|uniref:uncharacterized protein LOC120352399 n=1 Tax=Nilaparvata lugens TaxID=108931 RepID=UPI00193CEEEA|nr:uncharacterized protein LOC120352399 [Nilaparvata lugens]XP_039288601.1 uncharacterized protein LOC120352399 [Nilaparvata lugens]